MFCYCMNYKANAKLTGQIIFQISQILYSRGQNKCTNNIIFKNNSQLWPKIAYFFKMLCCTYFQDRVVGTIQFGNLQFEGSDAHYHIKWVIRYTRNKCDNSFRGRGQVVLEKKVVYINRLTNSNKLCTKTFKLASFCAP